MHHLSLEVTREVHVLSSSCHVNLYEILSKLCSHFQATLTQINVLVVSQ